MRPQQQLIRVVPIHVEATQLAVSSIIRKIALALMALELHLTALPVTRRALEVICNASVDVVLKMSVRISAVTVPFVTFSTQP